MHFFFLNLHNNKRLVFVIIKNERIVKKQQPFQPLKMHVSIKKYVMD